MKVIGLNASPRGAGSRTLRLVEAVLRGAREEGAGTELVDIYDSGSSIARRAGPAMPRASAP